MDFDLANAIIVGFAGIWVSLFNNNIMYCLYGRNQGPNFSQKCYQTAGPLSENFYRSSWILTGPSSVANNNIINTF